MAFLTEAANRGSVSTGYNIDNSLKLESDNTERVNKAAGTISGAGNRRTFTISFWTKRTEINGVKQYLFEAGNSDSNTDRFTLRFGTGDTFDIQSQNTWLVTNRVFRDTSAWYHFVIKVDTTDGTAGNRIKLYVNGVEETSFSTDNRSSINQNHDFPVNNTEDHIIGNSQIEGSKYYNGYIAEWIQLDGTAAAPTSFGEFDEDSNIWKPKNPSALSFGTNGFWLDFEDSSNLGNDASGGTDFTLTNVAAADQATDTPTNNFTTFNTLRYYNQGWVSFKEGATNVVTGSGNNWTTIFNTMAVNKGKWYFEGELYSNEITQMFGQQPQAFTEQNVSTDWYLGAAADKTKGAAYYGSGDDVYYEATYANSSASTGGDIISVAMDCDNNKVHFAVNGSWTNSSDPVNNTNGFAMLDDYQYFATALYPGSATWKYNFGGYTTISISSAASDADGYGTFEYAPPSGFYAMCTKNLAEYG